MEAADHQVLADVGLGHHQLVDVEAVVVLGVGDRRHHALADVLGDALARELEVGQRRVDLLAADHLRHEIELLRRHAQVLRHRLGVAVGEFALALGLAHLTSLHRFLVAAVAVERAGRRELAELVADHVLGHVHRHVLLAVVDAERQPDELRQDGRAPAPDLDDLVATGRTRLLCLLEQIAVDERAFPD